MQYIPYINIISIMRHISIEHMQGCFFFFYSHSKQSLFLFLICFRFAFFFFLCVFSTSHSISLAHTRSPPHNFTHIYFFSQLCFSFIPFSSANCYIVLMFHVQMLLLMLMLMFKVASIFFCRSRSVVVVGVVVRIYKR